MYLTLAIRIHELLELRRGLDFELNGCAVLGVDLEVHILYTIAALCLDVGLRTSNVANRNRLMSRGTAVSMSNPKTENRLLTLTHSHTHTHLLVLISHCLGLVVVLVVGFGSRLVLVCQTRVSEWRKTKTAKSMCSDRTFLFWRERKFNKTPPIFTWPSA